MEDKKTYELFKGKTLSDIFKDIYSNSNNTRKQVENLVTQLKPFVKSLESAAVIVPLIREYLDVSVKNDEHLVKLAEVVQRLLRAERGGDGEGGLISEEEKRKLLDEAEEYNVIRQRDAKQMETLQDKTKNAIEEIEQDLKKESDDSDGDK